MSFQKSSNNLWSVWCSKIDCGTSRILFVWFIGKLRNALWHFSFSSFFFLNLNFLFFKLFESILFLLTLLYSVLSLYFFILHLLHFSLSRNRIEFSLVILSHIHIIEIREIIIVYHRHSVCIRSSILDIRQINLCMSNHINNLHYIEAFISCSSC